MRRASVRALNVSFAILAIWTAVGCTPEDQPPPTLHVLDADGSPPATGYAPARQKTSSAPLNWNVLGQEIRSIAGAKRPLNISFNE